MAAKVSVDIDMYDAQVHILTLWQAAESIRKGALTNSLMKTTYNYADKKFDAYMATTATQGDLAEKGSIRHMFDWGSKKGGFGRRLWQTFMTGSNSKRMVTVGFLQSTKPVPYEPELQPFLKRKHVFRNKASMLEQAAPVTVKTIKAKKLVFVDNSNGTHGEKIDRGKRQIVFSKGPIQMEKGAAEGYYENHFRNTFIAFWTTGGQDTMKDVATEMGKTLAFRSARTVAAKKRVTNYKHQMNAKDATPEAKRRAAEMIKAIERQMTRGGRKK